MKRLSLVLVMFCTGCAMLPSRGADQQSPMLNNSIVGRWRNIPFPDNADCRVPRDPEEDLRYKLDADDPLPLDVIVFEPDRTYRIENCSGIGKWSITGGTLYFQDRKWDMEWINHSHIMLRSKSPDVRWVYLCDASETN